jgi:hypothetical protein
MIYVDDIIYWPGDVAPRAQKYGRKWCHLWCDPGEEDQLHAFAKRIGLRQEYYQLHRVVNHYDLVPSKREIAIFQGAIPMQMIEWLTLRGRKQNGESKRTSDIG